MLPVFMERRFLCKTVTFCFQTGYTSLVSANNEGLRAFKCVCVCVCVFALQLTCTICVSAHARASVCTCAYYSKNPRILTFILMLDQVKTQTAVNCWAKEKLKQTHRLCFSFFFFFWFSSPGSLLSLSPHLFPSPKWFAALHTHFQSRELS